jgi:hypothetical protein
LPSVACTAPSYERGDNPNIEAAERASKVDVAYDDYDEV